MKKIYLLYIALFAGVVGMNAQQASISPKVSAALNAKQISAMTAEELSWTSFIADNMCIISEMTEEKTSGFTTIDVGNQTGATTVTFNPLLINLQPLEHDNQYYMIQGTSKTLFVYSKDRLNVMYQRTLKHKK